MESYFIVWDGSRMESSELASLCSARRQLKGMRILRVVWLSPVGVYISPACLGLKAEASFLWACEVGTIRRQRQFSEAGRAYS